MELNNFCNEKENMYSRKRNQLLIRSPSTFKMKMYSALRKGKKLLIILTATVVILNSVLQLWIMTRSYSNSNMKITTTPQDLLPELPNRNGFWQPVSGVKYKFFVYSAYLETRVVFAVRVIAATRRRLSEQVHCRLWLSDGRVVTVPARTRILRDNGRLYYSAAYVMCVLRDADIFVSDVLNSTVSVIGSYALNGKAPTNRLVVRGIDPPETPLKNLHVCVKPFHSNYNQTEWLLEWLLLNTMFGVTHFYMYNQSMSESTSCLLKNFRINEFTILPWQLPLKPTRIRSEVAAYHDCLYRSVPETSWLLVLDVDEVLFPKKKVELPQLIETLAFNEFPKEPPASLLFQNAFYYTDLEDDSEAAAPLLTSRKTHRLKEVYPHNNLSRYVVKPGTVLELADHFVFEHMPRRKTKNVSQKIALVHHYRKACDLYYEDETNGADECLKFPTLVDRTAQKWTSDLWYLWRTEKNRIEELCGKLS